MTCTQYQGVIYALMLQKFEQPIINEWAAFRGLRYQYSPRVDIAVGPFSMGGEENYANTYDSLIDDRKIDKFLRDVYDAHRLNLNSLNIAVEQLEIRVPRLIEVKRKNHNARCLIALEIEHTNTKKHIMGSMVNAASLGRVGIGVAFDDRAMRTFFRILNYLSFLKRVEKNTYDTTNFLIVSKQQLQDIIIAL